MKRGIAILITIVMIIMASCPLLTINKASAVSYSLATAQGDETLEVYPSDTVADGEIYFYNVDGTETTFITMETIAVPDESWTVEFLPALSTISIDTGSGIVDVEQNLFVEPTPVWTEEEPAPEGQVVFELPNRFGEGIPGYTWAKLLTVRITVPSYVPVGAYETVEVNARAAWIGQTGAATIGMERPFTFNVVMTANPPVQPINVLPSNGAIGVSVTPTLNSSAFLDDDIDDTHEASQWQISEVAGDYSDSVYDSDTDTTNKTSIEVPPSTLDTNTIYYFRVRYQDSYGLWSDWSIETSFTTLNTAPNQPTNTLPTDEATDISVTPNLESSAFSDFDIGDTHTASQWQITATTDDYSSTVYDSGVDTSNKTSITIPSDTLDYETEYYFRVRHQDSHDAWSDWSVETSFITTEPPNTPPDQPTNLTPADEATEVSLTPTLQSSAFSDADEDTHNASQWQLTASSGQYTSTTYNSGADSTNLTSIDIPPGNLSTSTTYYWRVRHQDNEDWSEWSEETSFTTTTSSGGGFCRGSAMAPSSDRIASGWGIVGLMGVAGVYLYKKQSRKR